MYSEQKTFIVADFDDTIFAREEQLQKEQILRENRWDAGTKIMKEVLWIDYMMKNYYENKTFPKKIIEEIKENNWIVLTAWDFDLQKAKQKATKLDNLEFIVVKKAEQKPKRLVEYFKENNIQTDLVKIYEDRPKYFIENKEYLEKELNAKLEIYLVEMDWNRWYKKIELQN